MVTGTVPVQTQNEETVLALACSLYEQGARAESFRLLLRLSALGVKTAPLYYNQALCFEQAGQPDKALSCLEKALSCVTKEKREPGKPSGEEETLQVLYKQQCEQAAYRFPMKAEEPICLPAYARERILRLMIDICVQQNDTARAKALAASLPGNHLENVENALLHTTEKEN